MENMPSFISESKAGTQENSVFTGAKKQAYCDKNKEIILDDDIDEKFTNLKNDLITIIKAGIAQSFDDDAFTHNNSFYSRPAMVMKLLCVYSKETIFSGINMNKDKKRFGRSLFHQKNLAVYTN
ncbi:hypothetical protein HV409_13030 [Enterococcus faecium]|nr:hypothetical protein [Enterococcus faecium]